jgi:hypothetical protein
MNAERLLTRLAGVRSVAPDRWIARCPAHDDKSPSLSIRELGDGTVLVKCFAGCGAADVVEAVGLRFPDLFPPRSHHAPPQRRPFDALQVLHAIAHEAFVVALIAEAAASLSETGSERLQLACRRIHAALKAVGAPPESDEIKHLRRGEIST